MLRRMAQIAIVIYALFWVGCGSVTEAPEPADIHRHENISAGMESLFPETIEGMEWRRSDGVTFYDDTDLFNHINGAAEAFFAYGFQLCGTAEYIPSNGAGEGSEFIQVDVYDMERSIYAFGMYTSELHSESEFVNIGTQGYVETPVLNFWKGRYYVKIMSSSVDENSGEANMELAKRIAQKISGKAENPPMLSLLPNEGLVPGTETFVLDSVLAYRFLNNGVRADYQMGDEKVSLIIMESASSDESKAMLASFAAHEEESGKGMTEIMDMGEGGFAVEDKYYGRLIAARQGRYVVVALNFTDESPARELIKMAVNRNP